MPPCCAGKPDKETRSQLTTDRTIIFGTGMSSPSSTLFLGRMHPKLRMRRLS